MRNVRMMYLRPGNMYKDFRILTIENTKIDGRPVTNEVYTDRILRGCLTGASEDVKHEWEQRNHVVTDVIEQRGGPLAKEDEVLEYMGRKYRIHGVEDIAGLGIATLYYVEERKSL